MTKVNMELWKLIGYASSGEDIIRSIKGDTVTINKEWFQQLANHARNAEHLLNAERDMCEEKDAECDHYLGYTWDSDGASIFSVSNWKEIRCLGIEHWNYCPKCGAKLKGA